MTDPRTAEERLPPGPYHLEWPDHQGGLFKVWGRQGTAPDFADGWAIPLVAMGPQGPMEWLVAALAADPVPAPGHALHFDSYCATCIDLARPSLDPERQASLDGIVARHNARAAVPAPLARRRVSLTPACQADVRCYLSDGHYGEHMYPATPPEPEP